MSTNPVNVTVVFHDGTQHKQIFREKDFEVEADFDGRFVEITDETDYLLVNMTTAKTVSATRTSPEGSD
jgi:hypothetical protein